MPQYLVMFDAPAVVLSFVSFVAVDRYLMQRCVVEDGEVCFVCYSEIEFD